MLFPKLLKHELRVLADAGETKAAIDRAVTFAR
jgi:hypothetical protein